MMVQGEAGRPDENRALGELMRAHLGISADSADGPPYTHTFYPSIPMPRANRWWRLAWVVREWLRISEGRETWLPSRISRRLRAGLYEWADRTAGP